MVSSFDDNTEPDLVLEVKDLVTNFYTYEGTVLALDRVNLFLRRGDTMGVVGETGCGKSVTAKSILRLVESPGRIESGEILFHELNPETREVETTDILDLTQKDMLDVRGKKIAIVFQDPATFPNPVFRVGTQIAEVITLHQDLGAEALEMRIENEEYKLKHDSLSPERRVLITRKVEFLKGLRGNPPKPPKNFKQAVALRRAIRMLEMVKMPSPYRIAQQYPHELSGGMRQRALIAMALSCNPSILICDEATTALDVTVQAQVLNLLNDLKKDIGASIMIITHDLGVVAETCNWVNVMYAGTTVESAATDAMFASPIHPYTAGLLKSIPKLHENKERLDQIFGTVPNLITPPSGCRFHPRCEFATEVCKEQRPELEQLKPGHWAACHHPQGV